MPYVDGFVAPVPTARKTEYFDFARRWMPWFREMGAIEQVECWGDEVPEGKHTDFRRAVDLQEGETVAFAWIVWPDKQTRDAAYAKLRDEKPETDIPFDGKRMLFAGFTPELMEK